MAKTTKSFQYGNHEVTLETGEIARQASGAVMVSMGGTVVLVTAVAAAVTLLCATLLLRSASKDRSAATRYARRTAAPGDKPEDAMTERELWDALDDGVDPTQDRTPDNKGR